MKMALATAAGVGLGLALSLAGDARAAQLEGRVVDTDAATRVVAVQTDDGRRFEYRLDAATQVREDGSAASFDAIDVGERVTISSDASPAAAAQPVLATQVDVDAVRPAGAPAGEDANETRSERRLPDTASPIPVLGLAGAGALVAGLALRRGRR